MTLKRAASESSLKLKLEALASSAEVLYPLMNNMPLTDAQSVMADALVSHKLAVSLPRNDGYVLNIHLRQFLAPHINDMQASFADLPPIDTYFLDMAQFFQDHLRLSRQVPPGDSTDAITHFTQHCLLILSGMQTVLPTVNRSYSVYRDDPSMSYEQKMRRNNKLQILVKTLIDSVEKLRHGWITDDPLLDGMTSELQDYKSFRQLTDSAGFGDAYHEYIGKYVDIWLSEVRGLHDQITRYFAILKVVHEGTLKTDAVAKFLKGHGYYRISNLPPELLQHPDEGCVIQDSSLIDWRNEEHDALYSDILRTTKVLDERQVLPKSVVNKTAIAIGNYDEDELIFIEPFDQLATNMMVQAKNERQQVFIRENVIELVNNINSAIDIEESPVSFEVGLLAVIGIIEEHLHAASPMTEGIARFQLLGEPAVDGADLVWDACIVPSRDII